MRTATTPGSRSAAEASIDRIRACACGDRSSFSCSGRSGGASAFPGPPVLSVASPALLSLAPRAARAEDAAGSPEGARAPQRLGVTVATTYLGSGAGSGAAVSSGLRLALGRHFALGADLGYGLLGTPRAPSERTTASRSTP